MLPFLLERVDLLYEYNEIIGPSKMRDASPERRLKDDFYGKAGEMALSIHITGDIDLWVRTMEFKKNRKMGDNGQDLLGINVDIKNSPYHPPIPWKFHLGVLESDFRPNHLYIGACSPRFEHQEKPWMDASGSYLVHIIGYAESDDFPEADEDGRHKIRYDKLKPIEDLKSFDRWKAS